MPSPLTSKTFLPWVRRRFVGFFFNSPPCPPHSSELGRCVMRLLIAGWQITFSCKTISKGLGLETVIACLQVFSNWINAEQKECLLPKCWANVQESRVHCGEQPGMHDDRPVRTQRARSKPVSLKLTAVSNCLREKSLSKPKYNNSSAIKKGGGGHSWSTGLIFWSPSKSNWRNLWKSLHRAFHSYAKSWVSNKNVLDKHNRPLKTLKRYTKFMLIWDQELQSPLMFF